MPEIKDGNITDEKLLAQYIEGDQKSMTILVKRYEERAFRVAFRYCCNRELALDAVQEAFIRVLKHGRKFKRRRKFSSWFFTILLNRLKTLLTREKKSTNLLQSVEAIPAHDRGREERNLEQQIALKEALSRLTREQQKVISLRLDADLSYREIGKVLSTTPEAARALYYRGVKKLKQEFRG